MLLFSLSIFFVCVTISASEIFGVQKRILYDPKTDDVELLDSENFKSVLFGSPKATIIKFFAHWCGHCQRFAPIWKDIARDSKPWHDKVIRFAALDCALAENEEICKANQVNAYPTFSFFKPFTTDIVGIDLNKTRDYIQGADYFYNLIFKFLEGLNELNFLQLQSYK
jgi:thiol-disulfide isomerase/thioredoxin